MFGFFTLYANIPHHKLKSSIGELISFCFSGSNKEFIGITTYLFGLIVEKSLIAEIVKKN